VVASQYCFAVYPIVTALLGGKFISVPAKNYGHDLPAMLKAITPRTKIVFVADPNNPTGTHAGNKELLDFVKNVPPHVLLAIDQAYFEFLDKPQNLIPLILNGEKPNMILMRTFSKIYGLAGLRLGYGISSPELVAALEKIRQPFNINILAQAAGLAALDDAEHLRKTRETNAAGMKFFEDNLRRLGVEFIPSSGNFILIRVGKGASVFNDMQRLGVIVRPMDGYKLPEWIRITIGTAAENKRCLEAMKKVMSL
jgi:histidinol-phosphate aminotransferase